MKIICAIALSLAATSVDNSYFENPGMFVAEATCLADNVYHEGRGESRYGQLVIARVTINRAEMHDETICKTVYKPYQFSWTLKKPKINRKSPEYTIAWEVSHEAYQFNHHATYYHNLSVLPKWAKSRFKIERIGNHIFYR